MPLTKSPSKKALQHNIKVEMSAHPSPKDRDRNLAIAYSVQKKARKKKAAGGSVQSGSPDMNMAEGGAVSAKTERRPMPDQTHNDSMSVRHNSGNKSPRHDSWTDRSTETQAQSNSGRMVKPIKRPRMVPSDAFSTKLYDQEGNLMATLHPASPEEQPQSDYDESGPDRQGPQVRDNQKQHNNGKPAHLAQGGMAKAKYNDPMDDDQPSLDEGMSMAQSRDEEGQDRQGPDVMDMEDEHSTGRKPYAGGGRASDYGMEEHTEEDENPAHDERSPDDSESQPENEEHMEDEDSIAAAIMAKRPKHPHSMSDSDMDEMMMLYEGGEITEHSGDILSHGSMDSDDSDQVDMSRNHDEDANEEDQASFDALRKENYNDSDLDIDNPRDAAMKSDSEEMDSHDEHDMVSSIRRKMKAKRQFKQR